MSATPPRSWCPTGFRTVSLCPATRYEPESGELIALNGERSTARTHYLVLREGSVVFDGSQEELESSPDSYVQRFVRREEGA